MIKFDEALYCNVNNLNELFKEVANYLLNNNDVEQDYLNALIKRENEYPTGLQLPTMNIAIPHVDAKFIKNNKIVLVKNENNITVNEMCTNKKIDVQFFIFLLIKNENKHTAILSEIINEINNNEFIDKINSQSFINFKNTN